MGLARLVKWIGLVALVTGIIGLLLPGQFIYFPQIELFLTQFGDLMFGGISSNPTIKMGIAKAPAICLAVTGFIMVFWGTMKDFIEPQDTAGIKPKDDKKFIREQVEFQKSGEKEQYGYGKSVKELAGRKKP